jgi:hypothetical protein
LRLLAHKEGHLATERRATLTAVDILLYIQKHWKDGYPQFPNLRNLSPLQVLARLPEKDERYWLGEEGLIEILKEVK